MKDNKDMKREQDLDVNDLYVQLADNADFHFESVREERTYSKYVPCAYEQELDLVYQTVSSSG